MKHDFQEDLALTKGDGQNRDTAILIALIPGAVSALPASTAADKNGIDYVVTLRRGAQIFVDSKTRRIGCSKYWSKDPTGLLVPELALEKWSVMPGGKYSIHKDRSKVGWTLCTRKKTDFILYVFDPSDSKDVFLFSFQLLRLAFLAQGAAWFSTYKHESQDNGKWESESVFVPAPVVQTAVALVSQATVIEYVPPIAKLAHAYEWKDSTS